MGEVWRANDTRLGRAVAIKVLPPQLARNAQLKTRFEREARAISQLSHPNICSLYDVGEENGTSFLVMELLEGETLAERLSREPLRLKEVLNYGIQIATALDRAHRQHVVHRDLKPGNIMLTRSGAKLLDFGLAKSIGGAINVVDASAMTEQHHSEPLTAEGTIVGTFQYMAPEQLEGIEADARTDIFALGAVLYEMMTGRRAFDGKTRTSLIAAIVRGEPQPIAELQPLTPPALEHVIARCLAKEPDDRWQSAADVAAQLEWISRGGSQAGVAAPVIEKRKRRERTWIAIAIASTLLALALGAMLARRRAPAPRAVRANVIAPAGTSFIFRDGFGAALTVSPDGKWITFATESPDEDHATLWIRPIESLDARKLITEPFQAPFWSHDSRSVAYFSQQKLKRIDIAGGPPTAICDAGEGRGGTWSADGTIVFSPHWRGPLYRVSASGGPSQPLTQLDEKGGETTHRFPSFLPDGKHFIYLAGTHLAAPNSEQNAIYLGSLDSKERRLLLRARSNAAYVDGQLLFVRENFLLAQPLDSRTFALGGEARRVADRVSYETGFFCAAFSASRNGTLVYAPAEPQAATPLVWRDRNGLAAGTLATVLGDPTFRISPDGRTVALSFGDTADVWLLDLARGIRRKLTHDPMNDFFPVWSPDGKRLVYGSDRTAIPALFVSNADGTGQETPFLESPSAASPSDWSRDGRYFFFDLTEMRDRAKSDIAVMDLTDRSTRLLTNTPFSEWGARISPDGRWITYTSDESGRREAYLTSFPSPGARVQVSTAGAESEAMWVNGGREVIYEAPDRKLMAVGVTVRGDAVEVSPPRALMTIPPRSFFDVTADGNRVLTSERAHSSGTPIVLMTNWR